MPQRTSPPDEWVNIADHAVSLATGEVVEAYGGRCHTDMKDPHDKSLRDAGHLVRADNGEKS